MKIEFRKWAGLAMFAVVASAALFFAQDAFAHSLGASDVITASAALVSLRADHVKIVAEIKAKAAEMVAGLKPEQIAEIERQHAEMIAKRDEIERKIADEEAKMTHTAAPSAKGWAEAFYLKAGTSGLPLADLNKIVQDSATMEAATDALLAAVTAKHAGTLPGPGGIKVGAEATEKFVKGVTASIIGRVSMFNIGKPDPAGERNEFSGASMRELARMSLELRGVRNIPHDPMTMLSMAFAPAIMSGSLTTSDFANILANVANKSMLKGYEEAPETFDVWTSVGNLSDFKVTNRVDLGLFPSLAKVEEGAEYTYASVSDRAVTVMLATYGKLFSISRQAIINDDLNAFTKVPSRMGQAAKRTIADLVYAILTSNPTFQGTALFHATRNNLATGGGSALSVSSLDTGRASMAKQKDPDGIKNLNILPAYWIGPVALLGTAKQLFASQTDPSQSNPGVGNKVQGMATPVADARLDTASATAWYLAGGQQYDTIEVSYLNGQQAPTLETKDGWNVDGVEFKVRQDAGVNLLDYRALYKSAGA